MFLPLFRILYLVLLSKYFFFFSWYYFIVWILILIFNLLPYGHFFSCYLKFFKNVTLKVCIVFHSILNFLIVDCLVFYLLEQTTWLYIHICLHFLFLTCLLIPYDWFLKQCHFIELYLFPSGTFHFTYILKVIFFYFFMYNT